MLTFKEFSKKLEKFHIQYIDLRFTDLKGTWHHISVPSSAMTSDIYKDGIFFDGSSIAGWQAIHESDMILKPDFTHTFVDPFAAQITLVVFCDVYDPITHRPYEKDPRALAKRAVEYLISTGIGDVAYFGSEPEFFIFDEVQFDTGSLSSYYQVSANEFPPALSDPHHDGNNGHRPLPKSGYLPVSPRDSMHDLRAEMASVIGDCGLTMEKHHHEVAPAQHEIGVKYANLLMAADQLQIYKYVVQNVAQLHGKTATFMPKPVFGDNGSGMHVHQSLWKGGQSLFHGKEYAGLSKTALYYIGGILKHAKSLNAFTNPTTNSYKRLVPGFEAPVLLAYSGRNRSASCRIPISSGNNSKRVEVRFPDPTANGYLAFSAMLMAGLDGIKHKIHPGDAVNHDLYAERDIAQTLPTVCASLREALDHLEQNHQFLLAGNVFSKTFLKDYCALKWEEVYALEHTPHPLEFKLYYSS